MKRSSREEFVVSRGVQDKSPGKCQYLEAAKEKRAHQRHRGMRVPGGHKD